MKKFLWFARLYTPDIRVGNNDANMPRNPPDWTWLAENDKTQPLFALDLEADNSFLYCSRLTSISWPDSLNIWLLLNLIDTAFEFF